MKLDAVKEERIQDLAVLGDDQDGPAAGDDKGHAHEIAGAGDEVTRDPAWPLSGDKACDQSHGQEQPGDLLDVPVLDQDAQDQDDDAGSEDRQDRFVTPVPVGEVDAAGRDGLRPFPVQVIDRAFLRVLLDLGGVDHDETLS